MSVVFCEEHNGIFVDLCLDQGMRGSSNSGVVIFTFSIWLFNPKMYMRQDKCIMVQDNLDTAGSQNATSEILVVRPTPFADIVTADAGLLRGLVVGD